MHVVRQSNEKRRGDIAFWTIAVISVLAAASIPPFVIWSCVANSHRGLVPVRDVVEITASGPSQRQATASFQLVNHGPTSIKILAVEPSCNCVVIDRIIGKTIKAYSSDNVSIKVGIPKAGSSVSRVSIYHDKSRVPILLEIRAESRHRLPLLERVRNGSPYFHALRSTGEKTRVVVETREAIGSPRWIQALICDLEGVSIELEDSREVVYESSSYSKRTYTFSLRWTLLPTTSEFSGELRALTRNEPEPSIGIGKIHGYLDERKPVSPTVVYLGGENDNEELVTFEKDSGIWRLAPDFSCPSWLSIRWETSDDTQRLVLRITERGLNGREERLVHFVNEEGGRTWLKLIGEKRGRGE